MQSVPDAGASIAIRCAAGLQGGRDQRLQECEDGQKRCHATPRSKTLPDANEAGARDGPPVATVNPHGIELRIDNTGAASAEARGIVR